MERIAEGRTAEVFAWGDEHILKLYRAGWGAENAQHEFEVVKAVEQANIAAPRAIEQITHEGRYGIVYERATGITMGDAVRKVIYRFRMYARKMASLHAEMHQADCAQLPSQRSRIIRNHPHLLTHLENLPDTCKICHGDFHMENILWDGEKFTIIDWNDATCGTPAADVARSYLLFWLDEKSHNWFIRQIIRMIRNTYLNHYCELTNTNKADILAWMPIVATIRLTENIPNERELLMKWINP